MMNIKEMIDACIKDPTYAEKRKSVFDEAWEYRGEGAIRVADYIEKKYVELINAD